MSQPAAPSQPQTNGISSQPALGPWALNSWRSKPIKQQPDYKDKQQLEQALQTVRTLPPLVHHTEVDALRKQLGQVARGERFLLQGGDCAERFADCSKEPIEAKLKILLQMSLILTYGARIPTVRVGRVAGQYGKPRSSPTEKLPDGRTVMCFKGDNINGFDVDSREHDPARLVSGHFHSAATLNYIRALIKGGFADLHQSHHWDLGGVVQDEKRKRYEVIATSITDSLEFIDAIGVGQLAKASIREVDYFTSHEGLVMDYEEAVTRFVPDPTKPDSPCKDSQAQEQDGTTRNINGHHHQHANGGWYNLGAHFIWIGNRTRNLNEAHIEYFRGIRNPVGVKVDSSMSPEELVRLLNILDPDNIPGKITLISRFGFDKIFKDLPAQIKAVQQAGRGQTVVWSCDPMHGNTYATKDGIKTRNFDHILAELHATYKVHEANNSHLGGVHFELTGEDVTECVGGPNELTESHLKLRYLTYCDPRLNYLQAIEVAYLLADSLKNKATNKKSLLDELSPAIVTPR